ncbi:hypothetical protein [Sinimarinibacterium sp. NLF-5-8]|uniref:hypothetical protein n=1 Tax=Sinimarinibacterium sp. NLF-5-8 TaxID=2698684 RepID=UPI00137C08D2|nr:hypothetical protein [Sinimarinibacterium sp. NLF-5-8]QHS09064.1 hypothetical protein GT972_02150 [Sinimarinibacterium sp. NLF-5-8]
MTQATPQYLNTAALASALQGQIVPKDFRATAKAQAKWIKKTLPRLAESAEQIAKSASFTVRRYGKGDFYSWLTLTDQFGSKANSPKDPVPKSRWNVDEVFIESAMVFLRANSVCAANLSRRPTPSGMEL